MLSIMGRDITHQSVEDINSLLREPRQKCPLEIEFEVTESVMPSSGVFVVKLPNHPKDIGLTITGNVNSLCDNDDQHYFECIVCFPNTLVIFRQLY